MAKLIVILCIFLSSCNYHNLKVDSIIPGVPLSEVMCFDISGKVNWRCPYYEVKDKTFSPTSFAIGLGFFGSLESAFIPLRYAETTNTLTGERADSFEQLKKCSCYKNIKGEALEILEKHFQRCEELKKRAKKALFQLVIIQIYITSLLPIFNFSL